jgi:hypothetical protein
MSAELDVLLRERFERADLPRAPQDLLASLESVVLTPVDRRRRTDPSRPIRMMAIAAVLATAALAAALAGGALTRERPAIPSPAPTSQASSGPPLAGLALAGVVGLPEALASTCVDTSGVFQAIAAIGTAISCSDAQVTVEIAQVSAVGESGDPLTGVDVWGRETYRPTDASAGESPWTPGDQPICSSAAEAAYSDYAVGTRRAGRIGGCDDEGWLTWTIDQEEIVARVESVSGRLTDAVSWFESTRPVGGVAGLIWEVPWYACPEDPTVPGCDGPLAARPFATVWALARPTTYEELQALSRTTGDSNDGELVRLTGRVAVGFADDGWTGIDVRQISDQTWDQRVMVPEAFLAGPADGEIIDVVGWVGEAFGMPEESSPAPGAQATPGATPFGSLPHVDVAAYRSAL